MGDRTKVRLDVRREHEARFCEQIGVEPCERYDHPDGFFVGMTFNDWNNPKAPDFQVEGIPYVGNHDEGGTYGCARICGDGKGKTMSCDVGFSLDLSVRLEIVNNAMKLDKEHFKFVREYGKFEILCCDLVYAQKSPTS